MTHGQARRIAFLVLVALPAFSSIVRSSPNQQRPQDPLGVHGEQESREIHARCGQRIARADESIPVYLKALGNGRLSSSRMKQAGQLNVALNQLIRDGKILQWMGEPSGIDFERRGRGYKRPMDQVIRGYRGLESAQKAIGRIRQNVKQSARSRQRTLEQLERLVQDAKWAEAETRWLGLLDDLQSTICFLSPNEQTQILAPFGTVTAAIDQAMSAARRRASAQRLSARSTAATPNYAALVADAQRVASELAKGETAEWNGANQTAPQLLDSIFDQWKILHVATLRCRALNWALDDLLGKEGRNTLALRAAHQDFCNHMSESIVQLLEAEGRRRAAAQDPESLARVYADSAQALASVVSRTDSDVLRRAAESALERLAQSNFAVAEDTKAYERATGELLRWRLRVAQSKAAARAGQFPNLREQLSAATRGADKVKGLFTRAPNNSEQAHLVGTAPEAMSLAIANLSDRQFALSDVACEGDFGIARFQNRVYGSFSVKPLKTAAGATLDAMRAELLVDDDHGSLSLAAAAALAAAQRGDMQMVGGRVTDMHLEALVTRQATLPPVAWVFVPLGTLPPHFARGSDNVGAPVMALEQMQMRFELQPLWGHNGYTFIDLSN